jgi:hypothetical protein
MVMNLSIVKAFRLPNLPLHSLAVVRRTLALRKVTKRRRAIFHARGTIKKSGHQTGIPDLPDPDLSNTSR